MAALQRSPRLIVAYLVGYVAFYALAAIVFSLYFSFFVPDQFGAGIGLAIALPLMFLICTIFYFFVPGSTLLAMFFLGNFVLKASSVLKSVALAVGIWLVTFVPATALINVVYAGSPNMMLQGSSLQFVSIMAGSNLAGLIAAVLWVKLKPAKTK